MSRKSPYFALLIGFALTFSAHAACTLPLAPTKVPDGATASEQELLAAMQTLKRYANDVKNYTKCLDFEMSQNRLSAADQARLHNTAIDLLQSITTKFNEQVRIFKERAQP